MAQTQRISSNNTVVFERDGFTCVQLHQTVVIKWNAAEIILNSGGYQTTTTKTRMMQASNQYGLGISVYQKDHTWYVDYKGETFDFTDGMSVKR